jgi:signal transduction histidine kinase
MQVDAHGLPDALRRLAAQVSEAHSIGCSFSADDGIAVEDGVTAAHCYRITQEAVNNALKHAAAKDIAIRMRSANRMIVLEIIDNGVGIADGHDSPGRGLQIMVYRAGLIGAVLTVRKGERDGTVVSCGLPSPCESSLSESQCRIGTP